MVTPGDVTESCEELVFCYRGGSGIGVCLLIVMMGGVIERLKGEGGIGVEQDAILAC